MVAPRSLMAVLARPRRRRGVDRLLWATAWVASLGGLLLANRLIPAGPGTGTHTQLGLPPCAVLASTGFPCPGCGLTTSFAHLAHLRVGSAWSANPAGLPLFSIVVACALVAPVAAWCGWSPRQVLRALHADRLALALSLALGASWLLRVAAILLA